MPGRNLSAVLSRLAATSLACFTLCFLRTWFITPTSLSDFGLLSFDEIDDEDLRMYNSAAELLPFLGIGVAGGLLGAFYVWSWCDDGDAWHSWWELGVESCSIAPRRGEFGLASAELGRV